MCLTASGECSGIQTVAVSNAVALGQVMTEGTTIKAPAVAAAAAAAAQLEGMGARNAAPAPAVMPATAVVSLCPSDLAIAEITAAAARLFRVEAAAAGPGGCKLAPVAAIEDLDRLPVDGQRVVGNLVDYSDSDSARQDWDPMPDQSVYKLKVS